MSPQKLHKSPDDRHISKSEIQKHANSNFDITLFIQSSQAVLMFSPFLVLKGLTMDVLNRMSSYIAPPVIIQRILQVSSSSFVDKKMAI